MFSRFIPIAKNLLQIPQSTALQRIQGNHIQTPLLARAFHASRPVCGIEEFLEIKKPTDVIITGRGWTAADLRRKV